MMQYNLGSTSLLLINIEKYVKMANLDLSDLEEGPLERLNQIQPWVVD